MEPCSGRQAGHPTSEAVGWRSHSLGHRARLTQAGGGSDDAALSHTSDRLDGITEHYFRLEQLVITMVVVPDDLP